MDHADFNDPLKRLGRLDGLRGLAACAVAFTYHSQNLFAPSAFAGSGPIIGWFHSWGWTFVDLFFLISGYIFAHVYQGSEALRSRGGLASFAVARIARLYPLHLLTLVFCGAVFWDDANNSFLAFAAHLLMLQAFVQPIARTFDGPSWSLSVEVVCYILFAVGAASGKRLTNRITAVSMATGLLLILILGSPGGPWASDILSRGFVGFFTGQLLWQERARLARIPAALLAGLFVIGLAINTGPFSPLLALSLLTWPATILLALRLPLLDSKVMLWLGDRSYAIYLVHMPLVKVVLKQTGILTGGIGMMLFVHAAFIAAVLVIAEISFRLIENPSRQAIRDAWLRRCASKAGTVEPGPRAA